MGRIEDQGSGPCHWRFSYERISSEGGATFAPYLQVDSQEEVPVGAKDVVPMREGDELYKTLTGSGTVVHSHEGDIRKTSLGFPHVQAVTVGGS